MPPCWLWFPLTHILPSCLAHYFEGPWNHRVFARGRSLRPNRPHSHSPHCTLISSWCKYLWGDCCETNQLLKWYGSGYRVLEYLTRTGTLSRSIQEEAVDYRGCLLCSTLCPPGTLGRPCHQTGQTLPLSENASIGSQMISKSSVYVLYVTSREQFGLALMPEEPEVMIF